jgi:hypothetical protein
MQHQQMRAMLPILALVLATGACAEGSDITAPGSTDPARALPAQATIPPGIYVSVIAESDFPPGFPPEVIALLAGEWRMDFTSPRRYAVSLNGNTLIQGESVTNPARFVMRDTGGPLSCHLEHARQASGVYAWSISGSELTLTVVKDHCAERAFILTFKPWTLHQGVS